MVRVIAFLVPTAAVVTLGALCARPISALVEWLPTPRPTFTLCLPEGTRRSTFKTATHELEVEVTSEESCGYFECEPSDERWTSFEAQVAVSGSACRVSVPIAFVAGTACVEVEETSELVSIDGEDCAAP